jgi:hypothetical protein
MKNIKRERLKRRDEKYLCVSTTHKSHLFMACTSTCKCCHNHLISVATLQFLFDDVINTYISVVIDPCNTTLGNTY